MAAEMTTNNAEALRAALFEICDELLRYPDAGGYGLGPSIEASDKAELRRCLDGYRAALASQPQTNPHIGSSLDDFMREEGIASQPQAAGAGGDAVRQMIADSKFEGWWAREFPETEARCKADDLAAKGNKYSARQGWNAALAAAPAPAVAQDDARAVEAWPADVQRMIDTDKATAQIIAAAEAAGAEHDEDDNGQWWTVRYEHFRALATRPSAAPGPSAVDRARETSRRQSAVETLLGLGYAWADGAWTARQAQGAAVDACWRVKPSETQAGFVIVTAPDRSAFHFCHEPLYAAARTAAEQETNNGR